MNACSRNSLDPMVRRRLAGTMSQELETASQVEVLETMERLSRAGYCEVDVKRRLRPGEFLESGGVVGGGEADSFHARMESNGPRRRDGGASFKVTRLARPARPEFREHRPRRDAPRGTDRLRRGTRDRKRGSRGGFHRRAAIRRGLRATGCRCDRMQAMHPWSAG